MLSSRLAARFGGVLTAKEPLKRLPPECMQGRRGIELAGVELGSSGACDREGWVDVVPSLVSRVVCARVGAAAVYITEKYE